MYKGKCLAKKIAWVLVLVGALNWGLVGVGMIIGSDYNLVTLLFGSWPNIQVIVYLLVGVSALIGIWGCRCGECQQILCNFNKGNVNTNLDQNTNKSAI